MVPKLWHRLADTLRAGTPATNLYTWIEDQPELSRHFQEWMVALAKFGQDEVMSRLPLPPHARSLLDLGGGHALYTVALCRRYPALHATVMDSPRALEAAQTNVGQAGLAERVTIQPGNILADPLPAGQDAVLLFNIIHGFSHEQNQALIRKASAALNPGGLVVILEQLSGGGVGPASTAINRLLGLNYYHLLGGQIYPYETVARWMEQAGLGAVRRIDLRKVPGVSLVIGSKG
jgi:cyclopropane fatty-acyl-phospholipid synthase-like methyltransferase